MKFTLMHGLRIAFLFALMEASVTAGVFQERKQYGWMVAWLFLAMICASFLLNVHESIVINRMKP